MSTTTLCAECAALIDQPPNVEPHGMLTAPDGSIDHRVTYLCRECGAHLLWEDERTYPDTRWRLA